MQIIRRKKRNAELIISLIGCFEETGAVEVINIRRLCLTSSSGF